MRPFRFLNKNNSYFFLHLDHRCNYNSVGASPLGGKEWGLFYCHFLLLFICRSRFLLPSALLAFLFKNTCSDYRLQCHSKTRTRFCYSGTVQGISDVSWLFTVTSLLLAVLRIRITLMQIRNLLFSFMQIRIRILPFTLIRIRIRSYLSVWSGSFHSLVARFRPSNVPKWPSKASTFSIFWCGSGSVFLNYGSGSLLRNFR